MNLRPRNDRSLSRRLLLLAMSLYGLSSEALTAHAQVPCGYNVTEIITTPPCGIFQSSPTVGAISPSGELVVGTYSCIGGDERGFIYRTATNQFLTMPMPQGISSLWAFDVNDAGLVAGHMGGIAGSFGFVFDINTNLFIVQIPPTVNAGSSSLNAINASGVACGARTISDSPVVTNAMTWSASDGVTDLGVMNGPNSEATDITENNFVVGWTGSGLLATGTQGFLWQMGKIIIMDPIPGGLSSAARSANEIGQVLLWGRLDPQPATRTRSYLWQDGRMVDIGVLPGFDSTGARSINADSLVVGSCTNLGSNGQRFLWAEGVMYLISDLIPSSATLSGFNPTVINDRNEIVGLATTNTQLGVAFVATPVARMPGDANCDQLVNIADVLEIVGTWGPCRGCAMDFNSDGTVNVPDLLFVIQNWTVF